jgi:hypothetical protein
VTVSQKPASAIMVINGFAGVSGVMIGI